MDIRQIKPSDISAVTALHVRTLPSAIARIGNPYLSDLYHALDKNLCLVAVDNTMIVGVITATRDLAKTQKQMLHVFFSPHVLFNIASAIVKQHISIQELLDRMVTERQILQIFPTPYPTILTLFVKKSHQRQGVGTQLLHALLTKLPKDVPVFVDTEISNINAKRWYQARGFRKQKLSTAASC